MKRGLIPSPSASIKRIARVGCFECARSILPRVKGHSSLRTSLNSTTMANSVVSLPPMPRHPRKGSSPLDPKMTASHPASTLPSATFDLREREVDSETGREKERGT